MDTSVQYKNTRVVCPYCNGNAGSAGVLMDETVCLHCGDTGFVNKPVLVPQMDTPDQITTKVAAAIAIGVIALGGLVAFAVHTIYEVYL